MTLPFAAVVGRYSQANVADQVTAVTKAIGLTQYRDVAGRGNRPYPRNALQQLSSLPEGFQDLVPVSSVKPWLGWGWVTVTASL